MTTDRVSLASLSAKRANPFACHEQLDLHTSSDSRLAKASMHLAKYGFALGQRGAFPLGQRGALSLGQRGALSLGQRGALSLSQRGAWSLGERSALSLGDGNASLRGGPR